MADRIPMPPDMAEMFEYYWSLGKGRTKSKVAKRYGLSTKSISRYANRYDWDSLIEDRDGAVTDAVREAIAEDIIVSTKKAVEMASGMLNEAYEAFTNKKITPKNVADIERIFKIYAEAMRISGLSEEYEEVNNNVVSLVEALTGGGKWEQIEPPEPEDDDQESSIH